MKNHLLLFLLFLAPFLQPGCTTDSIDEPLSFPKEVNFEINDHLFPGKVIKVLEARDEKTTVLLRPGGVSLPERCRKPSYSPSDIMDLAWNEQISRWVGTHSSGLARIGEGK